ncbi:MAG: ferritin-like domain-containing protein [Chlamydiales bacterium]
MEEFKQIRMENRLNNSHRGEEKKLNRIIDAYQKLQGKYKPYLDTKQSIFWNAEHFNLHKSSLFRQASNEQQCLILEKCSKNLLRESYFVEKSAFAYCAKMMLLAETTEIAQVYSMIANEEAIHLEWITPYIDIEERHRPEGEFFRFLSYLIEECDCNLLPYLVQIILEGWGIHHYKSLAKGCQNERLKSVFLDIVRDEALHQHTGEVVFNARQASSAQHFFIEESLKMFAQMGQAGPLDLLSAVDEVMGGISQVDRATLLKEIVARDGAMEKLALLKNLMIQPGVESIVQKIDDEGYFSV